MDGYKKIMLHPEQITGVILAGGKSRRFGSNKALCKYGDKTFLRHLIDLIRPYTREVVIAGCHPEYHEEGIPVLQDAYPDMGPVGGIYTALRQSGTPWILALTCDMPLISKEVIMLLLASGRGEEVIGWRHDAVAVLFPMLIAKTALPDIERAIESKRYRVKQLFERGRSRKIPIPDTLLPRFANINTREDYKNAIYD